MSAIIGILRIFIGVDGVIYVGAQFNNSKFCNFITSWKLTKMLQTLVQLHETNKNMS